jgi:GAF domain-containing protein
LERRDYSSDQHVRLAEEQAALRRVATLVARGASPAEVYDTVAEEVGRLLGVASTGLLRFEPDETVTLVGGWGRFSGQVPVGTRLPLGGVNVASEIVRTGRSARLDRSVRATGELGEYARGLDVGEVAGGPIVVGGRLWGAMTVAAVEGGSRSAAATPVAPRAPRRDPAAAVRREGAPRCR